MTAPRGRPRHLPRAFLFGALWKLSNQMRVHARTSFALASVDPPLSISRLHYHLCTSGCGCSSGRRDFEQRCRVAILAGRVAVGMAASRGSRDCVFRVRYQAMAADMNTMMAGKDGPGRNGPGKNGGGKNGGGKGGDEEGKTGLVTKTRPRTKRPSL